MNFVSAKCPKCDGELQIPDNLNSIICMYCGEEITTQEAIDNINVEKYDKKISEENLQIALDNIGNVLNNLDKNNENFTKNKYPDEFKQFYNILSESMINLERAYKYSEDKSIVIETYAKAIIDNLSSKIDVINKKYLREDEVMKYSYSLVAYVIPAIMKSELDLSEELAKEIITQWNRHYPKMNLQVSTYDTIVEGFNKRRFCFITTAVCESFDKPDDCYELTAFRKYRDEWLIQQNDGNAIVQEYYEIAPKIVMNISLLSQSDIILKDIWDKYLKECLYLIESGQNEKCKDLYINMVRNLQQSYCN